MLKFYFFIAVIVSQASLLFAAPDFTLALSKVTPVKASIDYNNKLFCVEKKNGKSKTACRLAEVPSVGLMVCHDVDLEGLPCNIAINELEIKTLKEVAKEGIKTVSFYEKSIDNIKCGRSKSTECTGFLEEWLDSSMATFEHVSNYLKSNTAETMARKVIGYTLPTALLKTASDLEKLLKFVGPQIGMYNQICDLQGFFLHGGGFRVMDPAGNQRGMQGGDYCIDPDNFPSSQQVDDGLKLAIATLKKAYIHAQHRS